MADIKQHQGKEKNLSPANENIHGYNFDLSAMLKKQYALRCVTPEANRKIGVITGKTGKNRN